MKKLVLALAVLFCAAGSRLFAADWGMGIGLAVPNCEFESDGRTTSMKAVDLDLNLLRISDNSIGFTMKFGLDMGVAWSGDVEEDDTSIGFDFRGDFGLGITPLRTEHFMLTGLGVIGFGLDWYSTSGSWTNFNNQGTYMVRRCEYENQWNYVQLHVGLEVTGHFKFNDVVGLYTTLGMQRVIAGHSGWRIDETRYSGYYYDAYKTTWSDHDGSSMSGKISPLFAIGVIMYW